MELISTLLCAPDIIKRVFTTGPDAFRAENCPGDDKPEGVLCISVTIIICREFGKVVVLSRHVTCQEQERVKWRCWWHVFSSAILPASWLPRTERLPRSSFSQALGARYGASSGLQPHGRHSASARELAGPLSLSTLVASALSLQPTGRHFSPAHKFAGGLPHTDAMGVGTSHLASSGPRPIGRHFALAQ